MIKCSVLFAPAALMLAGLPVLAQNASEKMTFFITSVGSGKGADLGGVKGADQHCQALAKAVGAGNHTWHAYLSTKSENARDRIGKGPWYNAKGVMVAKDVEDLHSANNKLSKENSITEKGEVVNGRGDTPNQHDIMTGSQLDGTAFKEEGDHTCSDWSSTSSGGSAQLGHHDRQGADRIRRHGTLRMRRRDAARRIWWPLAGRAAFIVLR